jgi:hypothetical protein
MVESVDWESYRENTDYLLFDNFFGEAHSLYRFSSRIGVHQGCRSSKPFEIVLMSVGG